MIKMLKTSIGLFLVLAMGFSTCAMALTYYGYSEFGGTWHDAEKTAANTEDDDLCWAATTANVLTWTGWGTEAGFADTDTTFAYFQDHWTDLSGNIFYGADWWFDGVNDSQGAAGWSQVDVPGGGFWDPPYDFNDYYQWTSDDAAAMGTVDTYLHSGYGVGLSLSGPMAHQITAWGYDYDGFGNYDGVWVTDSDDDKTDPTPEDELQYYNVLLSGGRWYLQDYYGLDTAYISEVHGLDRYPGGEPQVPDGGATFLLLGLAAIGMGIVRKRS